MPSPFVARIAPLCALTLSLLSLVGAPRPAVAADAAQSLPAVWQGPMTRARAVLTPVARAKGAAAPEALRNLAMIDHYEDRDADMLTHLRAALYAPDSGSSGVWKVACWTAFTDAAHRLGRDSEIVAAASTILSAREGNPYLRACAQEAMANVLYGAGKDKDADAIWTRMGFVRSWRVIGPFDNTSRSGFDTAYAPEAKGIDYAEPTPGLDGLMLRWQTALVGRAGDVLTGQALANDSEENVYYASTAVYSPVGGPAVLRYDADGASKVYLNGVLVARDPIYRNHLEDTADGLSAPVTLKAGWNTVLIKIADDAKHNSGFRLRFTAPGSDRALTLTADPSKGSHGVPMVNPDSDGEAKVTREPAVVLQLRERLSAAPKDIEARYRLGMSLHESGDDEGAVAVLRDAVGRAPGSGILHWELSQALSGDEEKDDATAERTAALKYDSRLIDARSDSLDDEGDALPPAEAIRRAKSLLDVNPESPIALWGLAAAYMDAKMEADARRTALHAAQVAPGVVSAIALHTVLVGSGHDPEANALLAVSLRRFPNSHTLLKAQAEGCKDRGDAAGALAAYSHMLALRQPDPTSRVAMAELYGEAGKTEPAIAQLRIARRELPQNADVCTALADMLLEKGGKAEAIALYKEAVRLSPSETELRDKLQTLSGEKPVAAVLAPATETAKALANLPRAQDYPGMSEVRILDEGREVVYPDYASVMYSHEIVTVFDEAAVQKYQRYPVGMSSANAHATIEVARILKPDGKIVDCREQADEHSAAFPSLAAGDTIDLAYHVEDRPRGGLADKFWASWTFSDPYGPVRLCRYVLVTPKGMDLNLQTHGRVPDPSTRDAGAWTVHEWRAADLQPRKIEPLSPPERDSGIWVDVSTVRSWKPIVDWYTALSQPRCVPDAIVRAKAEELTKGATTEREKIRAIVEYVAGKIHYQTTPFRLSAFVPTEGKEVLRESYGDCKDKAALLTAMLADVGIKSHMALLSPREAGITPYLPGPRFSHAIAVVDTAEGPLWVDATADGMEYGYLPSEDQGVPALIIDPATTDLVTTPVLPPDRNLITETVETSLGADGSLSAQTDIAAKGNVGWILRSALRQVPESQRGRVMSLLASQMAENAHLNGGVINDLDAPDDPVDLRLNYTAASYAQTADTYLLVRLPWGEGNPASESGVDQLRPESGIRLRDVEMANLVGRQVTHLTMKLPQGYTIKDLTPEVKGETPVGTYRFTYTLQGDTLTAEREVVCRQQRIAAKDMPMLLQFMETVEKQTKKALLLEKHS